VDRHADARDDADDAGLGLVLRSVPYRDADLILTLYTAGHGRITALARGARGSRRRFAGTLGLLVLARYNVRRPARGDMWSLDSADVVREWTGLATDLAAFAHAGYAIELLRELAPVEAPDHRLLALVIALFDNLAASGASPAALRAFELALLAEIGSAPVLDACVACGVVDGLDGGGVVFDPGRGGVVCGRCAPSSRGAGVRHLGEPARRYLAAAATRDPADAVGLDAELDPADRIAARDAVLALIGVLLGRGLNTVDFIAKLQHRSP
jgi:DNA repair protein RecO (recombination protein O)